MTDKRPNVHLTIDGRAVEAPAGTNVLEAAKLLGISVPHFCYQQDLSWEGSCRMCLVGIEGRPKLVPSCCEEVREGMVVHVAREDAEEARRRQLEFLLINHPLDCPICDQAGECKLQDYYMLHGGYDSQMPRDLKVHKRKVVDLGPIVLDKERCVLCSRCVRFCREVSGSRALQFFTRGVTTEIGTENNRPIEGDGYIGNTVDICPVGALTSKDFRFKQRVWFLKSTNSICDMCSAGCNIRMDHKDGTVYRYVPRRNGEVNKSWMCDYGRESYPVQQENRIPAPLVREGGRHVEADWEVVLDQVAERTSRAVASDPRSVALIASPRQSTETNWITARYAREVVKTPHLDYRVDGSHTKTTAMHDSILRRQDPHPNNHGCAALGIAPGAGGADVEGILAACDAGTIQVLHLLGTELLTHRADRDRVVKILSRVPYVVVHTYRNVPGLAEVAHVVLADANRLEQEGTFVNAQQRVQRFERAFPPAGFAQPAAAVLAKLSTRLGDRLPIGPGSFLFDAMAKAEPSFEGLTWASLGPHGELLPKFVSPTETVRS
ncbi:MAG: 2Fe-2S iron-sulfur cluster-binding protein [Candidatus Eiseniibacteriota bacterium]